MTCPNCGKVLDLTFLRGEYCPSCLNSLSSGEPRPGTLQRKGRNVLPGKTNARQPLSSVLGPLAFDISGMGGFAILFLLVILPVAGVIGILYLVVQAAASLF